MNGRTLGRLSLLIVTGILSIIATRALTFPRLSAEQGITCKQCHVSAGGGGMRNEFGNFAVALNELCLPATKSVSREQYKAPRLAEPLVVGFDLRYLLLEEPRLFRMQTNFHALFEPIKPLDYVLRFDESGIVENYAVLSPMRDLLSVKVGRFTPSFGLRNDDHTSFNRTRTGNGPNEYWDGASVGISAAGTDFMIEAFDRFGQGVYGLHLLHARYVGPVGLLAGGSFRLPEKENASTGPYHWTKSVFGGIAYSRATILGELDLAGETNDTLIIYGSLTARITWGAYLVGEYDFFDPDREFKTGVDEFVRISAEIYPLSFVLIRPSYTFYTRGFRENETDWFVQFHAGY